MGDLAGRRVLVVEDEYFIADDLVEELQQAEAVVVGPARSREDALGLLSGPGCEFAIVDINLRGNVSFDVADALDARRIPFIFVTGFDHNVVPPRHAGRPLLRKPAHTSDILTELRRVAP